MIGISLMQSNLDPVREAGNLFAYWTAENAVMSASKIVKLPDQSLNKQTARDLVPVTTGPDLIYNDTNFNNRNSISSSTANIRLQCTFDTPLVQGYTVYLVMRVASNAGSMFWRSNAGNNVNSAGFVINGGPGTSVQATQDSSLAITSVNSVAIGNYVSCFIYNSTGVSGQYMNDSINPWAISPSQGSLDALNCNVMTIGNFGTANIYSWTAMACYSAVHTQPQRYTIMNFLGSKYGIKTT